jgi:2'-5' RNA ligase
MSFFLGIFPDKEPSSKISNVVNEIKSVFEGFEIPVRWVKPKNYHITVLHFGEKLPFSKKMFFKYRLKNFNLRNFKVKFNTVKLGISRRYKELIYLDLLEGGDEMRKLFLELEEILKINNEGNFTPHLTLGRVSKDLTNQEYSNICRDLQMVTKGLKIEDIEFVVEDIKLVKSTEGDYEFLMSLKDLSKTKV